MAQIISRKDPATGRRREIARVEGDSFVDRRRSLADALGTTPGRAGRLSNDQVAKRLTPGFTSFDAPIGTTALAGEPDLDLSTPLAVTGGAEGRLESSLTALPKRLAEERKVAERNEQQAFQGLFGEFLNQETPSAIRQREEGRLGVSDLDMQATELQNELTAEQERLRKEVERIQRAPGTATAAERDRAVAEATRISRRSQADLAITQLAAQGRLDAARRTADIAVQAETEYQEKRLQAFELVYNRNKDLFTKAEQREFETAQEDRKREAELEIFKIKAKYEQEIRQSDPLYQAQLAKARQDLLPPPGNALLVAQSEQGVADVSNLLADGNLKTAVGPNPLARISLTDWFTGGKGNFIAGVEQLRSQLSLDSLINAKANGATFGALSEGELKLLQQSGSKLSTWAQKDKEGNVVGYKASEADFKAELDKINNFKKLDYILKGGAPANVGVQVMADGTFWTKNSDGTLTQLR